MVKVYICYEWQCSQVYVIKDIFKLYWRFVTYQVHLKCKNAFWIHTFLAWY